MDEIELKFLDINVKEIKQKLEELGAKLKYDTQTESYPFLAEGFHSSDSNMKYLRIRKVNDDVKITYKDSAKKSDMTTREEIEIKVENYEEAIKLIEKLGFEKGKVFRKHRIHYEFGDIHFELDTLENIPTYLEIETQTEIAMKDICTKLGLDISNGEKGTIVEILPEMFNN
ncbi:MAG: class IV adenylate cyclase [bacterium]|nr:class IV adenylate cyclase [bacterium]